MLQALTLGPTTVLEGAERMGFPHMPLRLASLLG